MRISTRIALIGLPVLLAVAAGGSAISAAAKAPAASQARAAAVVDIAKAPSTPAVTTASTTESATPEKETPESGTAASATANEPAGGGHTDEVAGATTESNVDHQFDGNE
jgi:hypothetical protein